MNHRIITARAILASIWLQVILVAKRPMNIATGIVTPWMFLSLFLIPRLHDATALEIGRAAASSITASFWAASIWSGAGIIRREKWMGTLANILSGRLSAFSVLTAKTVGAVGYDVTLISISSALFFKYFGFDITVNHPLLLLMALVLVAVFGVCSSLLMSGMLILSRNPFHLTNIFGAPMLLLSGMLFPPELLPGHVGLLSRGLNLYWLHEFIMSLSTETVDYTSLMIGLGLSAGYLVLAHALIRRMIFRAKVSGTFELA